MTSPCKTPEQQISDYKKGLQHLLGNKGVFRRGKGESGEKLPSSRRSAGKDQVWGRAGVNFVLSPGSAGKRKRRKIKVMRLMSDLGKEEKESSKFQDYVKRRKQNQQEVILEEKKETPKNHHFSGQNDNFENIGGGRVFSKQEPRHGYPLNEKKLHKNSKKTRQKSNLFYQNPKKPDSGSKRPTDNHLAISNFQEKRAKWKALRNRRSHSKQKMPFPMPLDFQNIKTQMNDFSSFGGLQVDQNFRSSREKTEIKIENDFETLNPLKIFAPMTPSQRNINHKKQRRRRSKKICRPIAQFELGFETFEAANSEIKTQKETRQSHDWQTGARRFARKFGPKSPKVIKNQILEGMFATPRNLNSLKISKKEIVSAEQKSIQAQAMRVNKRRRKQNTPIIPKFARLVEVELAKPALPKEIQADFKKGKSTFEQNLIDLEGMKRERKYTGDGKKRRKEIRNLKSQTNFRKLPKLGSKHSQKKISETSEADSNEVTRDSTEKKIEKKFPNIQMKIKNQNALCREKSKKKTHFREKEVRGKYFSREKRKRRNQSNKIEKSESTGKMNLQFLRHMKRKQNLSRKKISRGPKPIKKKPEKVKTIGITGPWKLGSQKQNCFENQRKAILEKDVKFQKNRRNDTEQNYNPRNKKNFAEAYIVSPRKQSEIPNFLNGKNRIPKIGHKGSLPLISHFKNFKPTQAPNPPIRQPEIRGKNQILQIGAEDLISIERFILFDHFGIDLILPEMSNLGFYYVLDEGLCLALKKNAEKLSNSQQNNQQRKNIPISQRNDFINPKYFGKKVDTAQDSFFIRPKFQKDFFESDSTVFIFKNYPAPIFSLSKISETFENEIDSVYLTPIFLNILKIFIRLEKSQIGVNQDHKFNFSENLFITDQFEVKFLETPDFTENQLFLDHSNLEDENLKLELTKGLRKLFSLIVINSIFGSSFKIFQNSEISNFFEQILDFKKSDKFEIQTNPNFQNYEEFFLRSEKISLCLLTLLKKLWESKEIISLSNLKDYFSRPDYGFKSQSVFSVNVKQLFACVVDIYIRESFDSIWSKVHPNFSEIRNGFFNLIF